MLVMLDMWKKKSQDGPRTGKTKAAHLKVKSDGLSVGKGHKLPGNKDFV